MKAIIELNHYDGTTEFIGLKDHEYPNGDGTSLNIPDRYYGALEDYASNRYYLWQLPPKSSPEDPNHPGMGFSPPDLILEWEEIDWSELCVARCPDAKLPWLEQHRNASIQMGGCCGRPGHGVDGTIGGGSDAEVQDQEEG